eukprot:TRINITY_DN501_c0_g1_i3.p1 TRINITY_DN501_c0_g1~~TRINITY_DN501_c0_g1_i3.p1  ORF type:complete len:703 (+),score=162.72 TRINITY_DN501_c0_g1_i3:137-2245(+)
MTHSIAIWTFMVFCCFWSSTESLTVYVSNTAPPGGNGTIAWPFQSLRAALLENTVADEVIIQEGYYIENTTTLYGRQVTIRGVGNVILDCSGSSVILMLSTFQDNVTMTNLTMTGCSANGVVSVKRGYFNINRVTIRDSGGAAGYGACGGIVIGSGVVSVKNSSFVNLINGAIFFQDMFGEPSSLTVDGSRFQNNTSSYNYAVIDMDLTGSGLRTNSISINNSYFIDNERAINQRIGSLSLYNTNFFNNNAYKTNTANGITGNFAITCAHGSLTVNAGNNMFCGPTTPTVNCTDRNNVAMNVSIYRFDGCKVCGGDNSFRDCKGECFGDNKNCYTGKNLYVSPTGNNLNPGNATHPFQTIMRAVNAANSWGDTIILYEGDYGGDGNREITFLGKVIKMRSLSGQPTNTTVFCNWNGTFTTKSAFKFTSNESWDSVVEGIKVQSCQGDAFSFSMHYGASPTIRNCWVTGTMRSRGGGVFIEDSFPVIDGMRFEANGAEDSGGGVHVRSSTPSLFSEATVINSLFLNNFAGNGGGVFLQLNNRLVLSNNIFVNNNSTNPGSAILVEDARSGRLVATNNSIFNNITGLSVVACLNNSYIQASNNKFCGNNTRSTCNAFAGSTVIAPNDCGVCGGAAGQGKDCAGICFGYNRPDNFGGCCLVRNRDCNGVCNGPARVDSQGTCCASQVLIDCNGVCGGLNLNCTSQ